MNTDPKRKPYDVRQSKRFASRICRVACALAVFMVCGVNSASLYAREPDKDWRGKVDYWQPQWMQRELWGAGRMPKGLQVRVLRHWTYVNSGVPKAYAGQRSTIEQGAKQVAEGGRLYRQHCVRCHGPKGLGDGDMTNALMPSPALLAYMIKRPISVDEYLLWSIADGGKPFATAMPAFKDKLSREEIWKIVAYLRGGFPQ